MLAVPGLAAAEACAFIRAETGPGSLHGGKQEQPFPYDFDRNGTGPDPALVAELVGWIALNTTYDVSMTYHSPPAISFCSVGDTVAYEDGDLLVDAVLHAVYDLKDRRIFLVQPWSVKDPYDVSVLLHELIHDVQLANRTWDCVGAPEFEAYWLQDKWLAQRGVRPGFNWPDIRKLSICPEAFSEAE